MAKMKDAPYKDIGGQAVMEGVMMQSPGDESIAIAVRRPDGKIYVNCEHREPITRKHPWMGKPFIRGCVNMVLMLKMGMETLDKSTRMLGVLEEEPSKFEKWLAKKFGADIDSIVMTVAMVLAVALSLFLFVAIPSAGATLLSKFVGSRLLVNLCSGVLRIAILIGYMAAISLMPDIKRVFQYHGAEHKTVFCNEHDMPLTPANARQFSRLHPRCGTAFLFLVMFISILVGSVADELLFLFFGIGKLSFLGRILRSIVILPLITGISYEVLKGLAHAGETALVRGLRWPGLMMQYLTTREPDDEMLEVAIVSMKAAKAGPLHYTENLGENVVVWTAEDDKAAKEKQKESQK